jgi:hypothetical protein
MFIAWSWSRVVFINALWLVWIEVVFPLDAGQSILKTVVSQTARVSRAGAGIPKDG